jgi:Tfp pilus assembly protein PilF
MVLVLSILVVLAFANFPTPDTRAATQADPTPTPAATRTPRAAKLLRQGIENIEAEAYEQAVTNLSEAIALEPGNAEAYSQRGRAYLGQGDLEQAIEDFDKAIELNPNLADAYRARGVAYLVSKDLEQAI